MISREPLWHPRQKEKGKRQKEKNGWIVPGHMYEPVMAPNGMAVLVANGAPSTQAEGNIAGGAMAPPKC
jgi:hypothetical protein